MPTINDATVVASAYDTSSNGGRKLVRISDGTLISVLRNGMTYSLYKSTDDGTTWTSIKDANVGSSNINDICLAYYNGIVYVLLSYSTTSVYVQGWKLADMTSPITNIMTDTGQTALGNVSLAINDAGTELHATWASKNATYPNSFNIRYAKGTINADGSVTWGAVEQTSTYNATGGDNTNPNMILINNNPLIIVQNSISNPYRISAYSKNNIGSDGINPGTGWHAKIIYSVSTYAQSYPSAIFVPQSINGLVNGRIWVAWHGYDSTDTAYWNLRISYSDDGGATWASMQKLTSGSTVHSYMASITANKNNEVFIEFQQGYSGTPAVAFNIYSIKNTNGTWDSIVKKTNNTSTSATSTYPSTLFDVTFTFNFTEPLFIYKDTAKVGFYGTWTVTTISVTQGSIGTKTSSDKTNLLTYSITTDGTMGAITESVNGAVTATHDVASGASVIAGLTQAQWDAIKYGKYNLKTENIASVISTDWEQGSMSGTIGSTYAPSVVTTRIRTKNAISVSPTSKLDLTINASNQAYIYEYDINGLLTATQSLLNTGVYTASVNTYSIRLMLKKIDNTDIAPNDIVTASLTIMYTTFPSNTLTVSMGSDVFTYTFDKRLATTDDLISAVKSVQDANGTYLPAVKSKLGSAIRGKGGTVSDTDSLETMASAVGGMPVGKKASGTITNTATTASFTDSNGSLNTLPFIDIPKATLSFVPSTITVYKTDKSEPNIFTWKKEYTYVNGANKGNVVYNSITPLLISDANLFADKYRIPVRTASGNYTWEAYE